MFTEFMGLGPKVRRHVDDALPYARKIKKKTSLSNDPQLLGDRCTKRRIGSGRARQTSVIVAWRTGSHSLVNMGGPASPPR